MEYNKGQDNLEFERIYKNYYSRMKRFAREYVLRDEDAENIVQDVFLDLWERKYYLLPHSNLFSYMLTTIKNRCLDFLRHKTVEQKAGDTILAEYHRQLQMKFNSLELLDESMVSEQDIDRIVQDAVESLPEQCRIIFIKNKFEGKKQKEIAQEMEISVNTVESQMSIAYKKLRQQLKNYLPILLFLLN